MKYRLKKIKGHWRTQRSMSFSFVLHCTEVISVACNPRLLLKKQESCVNRTGFQGDDFSHSALNSKAEGVRASISIGKGLRSHNVASLDGNVLTKGLTASGLLCRLLSTQHPVPCCLKTLLTECLLRSVLGCVATPASTREKEYWNLELSDVFYKHKEVC